AEDTTVGGCRIRQGQSALFLLAAAHRDPARYAEPDRLDVTRSDHRPLVFGSGPHYCLGAALAKLEGELVLGGLLERFPSVRLATEDVSWRPNAAVRALSALPVAW